MRNFKEWRMENGKWKIIRGFTLLELLIVMAVLGILARFIIVTFPASQKRARDTQRKSDLKQYQTSLEVYANKNNGFYPVLSSTTSASDAVSPSLCNSLGLDVNPSPTVDCSADPKDNTNVCSGSNTCRYYYISNASGATEYVLWGTLEQPADSGKPRFFVCSNGKSGEGGAPSGSACPI